VHINALIIARGCLFIVSIVLSLASPIQVWTREWICQWNCIA